MASHTTSHRLVPIRILRAFIASLLLGIPALPADDVKTTET